MVSKAGRGSEQFMLRMPDGMRDRIRAAAEANGRSMNGEVIKTLEQAYPGNKEINQTAAEIVRLADALRSEDDPSKKADIISELQDMDQVLRNELDELRRGISVDFDKYFLNSLK